MFLTFKVSHMASIVNMVWVVRKEISVVVDRGKGVCRFVCIRDDPKSSSVPNLSFRLSWKILKSANKASIFYRKLNLFVTQENIVLWKIRGNVCSMASSFREETIRWSKYFCSSFKKNIIVSSPQTFDACNIQDVVKLQHFNCRA